MALAFALFFLACSFSNSTAEVSIGFALNARCSVATIMTAERMYLQN